MAATDDENKIYVSFEARVRSFERALAKMQGDTSRSMGNVRSSFDRAERGIMSFDRMASSAVSRSSAAFSRLAGVATAALSGTALLKASESFTRVGNALSVAGVKAEDVNATFDRLYRIAQANASPIETLAGLYSKAAMAQANLGATSGQLMQFTEAVAQSLRVSGKSAEEASGALLQLGQALSGSAVQAEEYNSLIDGAYPLLQAAAAGMKEAGGEVSKLTALVKEGKVSAAAFFNAILAGAPILGQKLAGAHMTVAQAGTEVGNSLTRAVGKLDEATGASRTLVGGLESLSGMIDQNAEHWAAWAPRVQSAITKALSGLQPVDDFFTQIDDWMGKKLGVYNDAGKFVFNAPPPAAAKQDRRPIDIGTQRINGAFDLVAGKKSVGEEAAIASLREKLQPVAKPISIANFPVVGAKTKGAGGSEANPYESAADSIRKRIAILEAETATIGQNTAAREKARQVAELTQAAYRADLPMTDQLRNSIDQLAGSYANAVSRAEEMQKAHEAMIGSADRMREALSGATTGFISDLRNGKTAAEALGTALNRIADQMINRLVDNAVSGLLGKSGTALGGAAGGSGVAGWLASLFHDGGIAGQVPSMARVVSPGLFSGAPRFHSGLLPGELPAILKRGEAVLNDNLTGRVSGTMAGLASEAANSNRTSSSKVDMTLNLAGANGDEAIQRSAIAAAKAVVAHFSSSQLAGRMDEIRIRGV